MVYINVIDMNKLSVRTEGHPGPATWSKCSLLTGTFCSSSNGSVNKLHEGPSYFLGNLTLLLYANKLDALGLSYTVLCALYTETRKMVTAQKEMQYKQVSEREAC